MSTNTDPLVPAVTSMLSLANALAPSTASITLSRDVYVTLVAAL